MSDSTGRNVSRRKFLIGAGVAGAAGLAGCTGGGSKTTTSGGGSDKTASTTASKKLSGDITITGSSTVYPLASAVARRFQKKHRKVNISVSPTGSGAGFSQYFCVGNSQINNASRPIKKKEKQLCRKNGIEWHEIKVATDALTVIVNNKNDWVDCMTPDQLRQIWKKNPAQKWSDVNSDWPDEPINRYGAADTSGTYDYFKETILGEETAHTTDYQATEKDNIILQGVKKDKYAIGYFGFAYYHGNKDAVKALAINNGNGCIKPSLQTAKSGKYKPLSRPLFTYPAKSALKEDHIAEFCRFFTKQSANDSLVAEKVGYVPNTKERMQKELAELNKVISNVQ